MTAARPERPPAYILAGGRSSRFGSDKARALLHGEPLLLRQARLLTTLGHRVTIVGRWAGQYQDLGLATIGDSEPDLGPRVGLQTALRHRGEGWLLLSSCDLVVLRDGWLVRLLALAGTPPPPAIAYRDERWQPFPGLYHTSLLSRPELFEHGGLCQLLDRVGAVAAPLPPDWTAQRQANTPAELQQLATEEPPA